MSIFRPCGNGRDDIRYLLDHFLQKFTRALDKTIVGFTPSTMQTLLDYHYPGNIRELSNIVEYAVNICKRKKINKEHLPPYLFEKHRQQDDQEDTVIEPAANQLHKLASSRPGEAAPETRKLRRKLGSISNGR